MKHISLIQVILMQKSITLQIPTEGTLYSQMQRFEHFWSIKCFVDFLIENKLQHLLQRTTLNLAFSINFSAQFI